MENNNNRQVVVIKNDDMDGVPSKWTWKKYGKSIAKFKWWVTGFTLGIGVIGLLGFQFILNPMMTKYTSEFSYNLPFETDDNGNVSYISDGARFDYRNLISLNNLQTVKDSDSAFSKIDVAKIVKNNAISISLNGTTDSTTNEFVVSLPITYTISGKLEYLGKQDVATKFITNVIDLAKSEAKNKINNYKISNIIPSNFADLDYDAQVDILDSQYDIFEDTFAELLKVNSNANGDENGTSLQTIKSNFEAKYKVSNSTVFESLLGIIENKHYTNLNDDYSDDNIQSVVDTLVYQGTAIKNNLLPSLIVEISSYKSLYESAVNSTVNIEVSTNSSSSTSSNTNSQTLAAKYAALIESATKTKNSYVNQLRVLGYGIPAAGVTTVEDTNKILEPSDVSNTNVGKIQKLTNLKGATESDKNEYKASCNELQNNIVNVKNKLISDIDSNTNVYRYVYNTYRNSVTYSYPGVISIKGGFSPFIGLGLGLLIGFFGSSLICCGVYISDEESENK